MRETASCASLAEAVEDVGASCCEDGSESAKGRWLVADGRRWRSCETEGARKDERSWTRVSSWRSERMCRTVLGWSSEYEPKGAWRGSGIRRGLTGVKLMAPEDSGMVDTQVPLRSRLEVCEESSYGEGSRLVAG